jgi:ABC-2 type transport system ATP-binding protein
MIETIDLTKKYGDFYALESLDLKLEKGDLFGFIGPNGAGKTTTIRILSTLLAPTWGEAYVCGYSIYTNPREIRRAIGYMPDIFGVYDDMRVIEYLEFFAAAYRIDGPQRRVVAERSLELVDLAFKRDELVTSLSRGMTQRLGLARVLLHDPQVLLLDEPASGLDPRARIEMRGLLKRLQGLGKTILVSSHILPELADICNRVGIIEYGRLLACGDVQELLAKVRGRPVIRLRVAGAAEDAARLLETAAEAAGVAVRDGEVLVTLADGVTEPSALAARLVSAGHRLLSMREQEVNLETAFLELTKGALGRPGQTASGAP